MFPIYKYNIPNGIKVTCNNFICNIRLQKKETRRVCYTYVGYFLDYPIDPRSPAVSILDDKIHTNNNISDTKHGARYLGIDIKNFYLSQPMSYFQYVWVHHTTVPQETIDKYNPLVETDGNVYF